MKFNKFIEQIDFLKQAPISDSEEEPSNEDGDEYNNNNNSDEDENRVRYAEENSEMDGEQGSS